MKNIIKFKNVSKFYYSKGVIASGFSKINLDFKLGEFVAITGESGSGKSTLLNVISGLDSYEEGELYINGEETSHYTDKDFEDYRRKYIGNIFQNFNLVNSYTVYQNIELVLLLNGNKKKDIKAKVLDLIRTVDLYRFRNTKVSKLSGGQKQRVAIARALAKETPIIIADEPTGNLDSRSAESIIKLLSEISKDKLVIVVTHNYDQVEPYVTRKIKMHDGKVLEDKEIKKIKDIELDELVDYKNITFLNKIKLGLRNTFNIIPKFLLVMVVYAFITVALISEYASFKQDEYNASKDGYNYYFNDVTDDTRVIIKKNNKEAFTDEDYKALSTNNNIETIFKNDLLLDRSVDITDNDSFWFNGNIKPTELLNSVDVGRMPENENEIVIYGNKDDYYVGYQYDEVFAKDFYLQNINSGITDKSMTLKVVGIKYATSGYDYNYRFYVSNKVIDKLSYQINQAYSKVTVDFQNLIHESTQWNTDFGIATNPNVPSGYAYMTEDNNYLCPNYNCLHHSFNLTANNLYYTDNLNLNINNLYNKNNYANLLGLSKEDYDMNNGIIYINPDDYSRLFNKGDYQSSVFVNDIKNLDELLSSLQEQGYTTLAMRDVLVSNSYVQAIKIFKTVVTLVLVVALFFVSYFVIRIILKSRNVYFSTIRMLGATKKISKQLLIIELLAVSNLAFILFMVALYLNYINIYSIKFMNTIINYLTINDYIILYVILILMSYLVSEKFAKKLFKDTAIKTLKEEV